MPIIDAGLSGQMVDIIGAGFDAFTTSPGDGVMTLFRDLRCGRSTFRGQCRLNLAGRPCAGMGTAVGPRPRPGRQSGGAWRRTGPSSNMTVTSGLSSSRHSASTVTHVDVGQDSQPFALAQPASDPAAPPAAYDMATGIWQTPMRAGRHHAAAWLSVGDATRVYDAGQ
ncbi:MAG: hypothetical protein R2838_06265 [Caldilineaceae bacterium]